MTKTIVLGAAVVFVVLIIVLWNVVAVVLNSDTRILRFSLITIGNAQFRPFFPGSSR